MSFSVSRVHFSGPWNVSVHLGLRLRTLRDRLRLDAVGPADLRILPGLLAALAREAAEVGLDERLRLLEIDVADEHEREVGRVGEAVLVDGNGLVEVDLLDRLEGRGAAPEVVLRLEERHVLRERALGREAACLHELGLAGAPRLEGVLVLSRRDEREVGHLEEELEIRRRRLTGEALLELADPWAHRRDLAGERLPELHRVEIPEAALRDDRVGDARRVPVGVLHDGRPAGGEGREADVVVLERRRLQDDPDAVLEGPLGDPDLGDRRRLHDRAGRRRLRHQRAAGGIVVRLDLA